MPFLLALIVVLVPWASVSAAVFTGERSVAGSVNFTATIIPTNTLAMEQYGEIVVADACIDGRCYHEAFLVEPGDVVTATAEGLFVTGAESALAFSD